MRFRFTTTATHATTIKMALAAEGVSHRLLKKSYLKRIWCGSINVQSRTTVK